jgi:hypothetical protein
MTQPLNRPTQCLLFDFSFALAYKYMMGKGEWILQQGNLPRVSADVAGRL